MLMFWIPVLLAQGDAFQMCLVIQLKRHLTIEHILSPLSWLKGECSISRLQRGVIFPTICLPPTKIDLDLHSIELKSTPVQYNL